MTPIPKICNPNSVCEVELEFIKLLRPITVNPMMASEHPIRCLFSIAIFTIILEKMREVTMAPPCRILKVEPEMKLNAMYCMIDRVMSQKPGMRK
jgi:hypothetical protein